MKKTAAIFYVITIVLIYNAYTYVNNRVIDPFMIDASKSTTENAAADLLNTKQDYNFRLVNKSDKAVILMNIELQGCQGIKIGTLNVLGKPLVAQEVKSNRVYNSPNSWSTNSQGLIVEYQVEILEPKIQNPKSAIITYSYLGIKHKQVVNFSGGTVNTIIPPKIMNLNLYVSILSTIIALILLIFLRDKAEAYLGLKLFGYYYLGAFNLNFNILIPFGSPSLIFNMK